MDAEIVGINLSRIWPRSNTHKRSHTVGQNVPLWDFHCHLLPGVDDGLRTLEETRQAITDLQRLGYTGAVLTPHIYPGVYENNPADLRQVFSKLKEALSTDFPLSLAAEYFADENMGEVIANHNLLYLPLGEKKLVLVEFPLLMPTSCCMDVLIQLRNTGYQPVLAHVERYRYVQQQPDVWLKKIANTSAWIQCDIGSLVGQYGRRPESVARLLLAKNLATLWGTDLHRVEQIERYIVPGLAIISRSSSQNILNFCQL